MAHVIEKRQALHPRYRILNSEAYPKSPLWLLNSFPSFAAIAFNICEAAPHPFSDA